MKKRMIIVSFVLGFLYSENAASCAFGFPSNEKKFSENSGTTQTRIDESNFVQSANFDAIYRNLPETGTTTRDFAFFTANPKSQKVFQPHLERIKLINCRNLQKIFDQQKSIPQLSATEHYSGPAALELAQSGKKVAVLIFADSTNVGGIYLTKEGNPAGTQEEQTVLMAPEIYGFLGNNFGVNDIAGNGDGRYSAQQKRYSLNKDDYENLEVINPAYGFILTNLLITHDVERCSKMIKLPKDKVVEISYAFLSMPSFATDVSWDPIGAMLINQSGEKDGESIYRRMKNALSILRKDKDVGRNISDRAVTIDIGKIAIFYSTEKLQNFSKKYLKKDLDPSNIIAEIVKLKLQKSEKVLSIFEEAQRNYEKCVLNKFTNLIRGAETAGADTLVLGKIGCGAFLNDENEIARLMGKALSECRSVKYVYFAGLNKTDPFVEKVKAAIEKNFQH